MREGAADAFDTDKSLSLVGLRFFICKTGTVTTCPPHPHLNGHRVFPTVQNPRQALHPGHLSEHPRWSQETGPIHGEGSRAPCQHVARKQGRQDLNPWQAPGPRLSTAAQPLPFPRRGRKGRVNGPVGVCVCGGCLGAGDKGPVREREAFLLRYGDTRHLDRRPCLRARVRACVRVCVHGVWLQSPTCHT